jgi:hypothetical protein
VAFKNAFIKIYSFLSKFEIFTKKCGKRCQFLLEKFLSQKSVSERDMFMKNILIRSLAS